MKKSRSAKFFDKPTSTSPLLSPSLCKCVCYQVVELIPILYMNTVHTHVCCSLECFLILSFVLACSFYVFPFSLASPSLPQLAVAKGWSARRHSIGFAKHLQVSSSPPGMSDIEYLCSHCKCVCMCVCVCVCMYVCVNVCTIHVCVYHNSHFSLQNICVLIHVFYIKYFVFKLPTKVFSRHIHM